MAPDESRGEMLGPLPHVAEWNARIRRSGAPTYQGKRAALWRSASMDSLIRRPSSTPQRLHVNTTTRPVSLALTPEPECCVEDEGLGRSPTDVLDNLPKARASATSHVSGAHTTSAGGDSARCATQCAADARRQACRKSLDFGHDSLCDTSLLTSVSSGSATPHSSEPSSRSSVVTTPVTLAPEETASRDSILDSEPPVSVFARLGDEVRAEHAAAHFNMGVAALGTGDTDIAISHFEAAVALGHTKGKVNLAQLYLASKDAARVDRAKVLLREACRERDPVALAYVGAAYRTGTGPLRVPRDPKRAARILSAAVKLGNPDAMLQLSLLYSAGEGVPQSDKLAFKLCCQAAPFRAAAQRRLAKLYRDGRGCDADQNLARMYLESSRLNAKSAARTRSSSLST
eukprot:m.84914 g.84914  ORF g.84914 m.84914 type:complete len:402 (-) comp9612_c0_seq1:1329-2534(-)